jgi:sn-glycerol 3-phosphate transport system permease protein
MQSKRALFPNNGLPYLLLAPQLIVTIIFFLWPAGQAVLSSFQRQDPFGLKVTFVWFDNYQRLLRSGVYLHSLGVTAIFAISVAVLAMGLALILAAAVSRALKLGRFYTTLLVWPYAVAPAAVGLLWWFMFNPSVGILSYVIRAVFHYDWNHRLHDTDAMILIVVSAVWKQISYNFLFFVAGMASVPQSLTEAAALDGAGPVHRFWTVIFPLIAPTTFFLTMINITYAMFDTFPIVDTTTSGGPNQATNILVYKVYADGFLGLDLGSSAAQSVLLMIIVVTLTVIQFCAVERETRT